METSIVLLVNVVLWSTGLSVAALAVLLTLDWLEGRRTQRAAFSPAVGRLDSPLLKRPQQPTAPRRRPAANKPVAAQAA